MTVTDVVAGAFAAAGFVAPDYGGQCLDGVLAAAAGALGHEDERSQGARDRLGVPVAERVCVVLVDGLGQQMLSERAGHAPFLGRAGGRTLTVAYPSTTVTSMGLFGTGHGPGRTGLVGYTARNPENGKLANLVSWDGAGSPTAWQREPSIFSGLIDAGVPVTSVGPRKFAGSGLTEAALAGAQYVRAESLADRVDAAVFELAAPGLTYLYWGDVDKTGHQHGWRSREWGDALSETDRELARLTRSLPRGTTVLITADHGMVDVDHSRLVDVATTPALARDVVLVAGEPRASHVHVRPGTEQAVVERWRETLGDLAVVALQAEAIAAGWFGPVADHVLPLLGDVVVAARDRGGVVDSRTQTPHSLKLKGMHGSFTPGEMLVPLLVIA